MITKPLIRNAFKIASFVFVFLWTTLAVNAQCPALNPSPPTSPICNATGFKVSDLNAYAVDNGGGIAWYSSSTGGTALSSGQLVAQRTYYLDTNPASCSSRLAVNIDFTVNPTGQILDKVYCSNENATIQTYIDDVITTYIPSGGSVRIYNDLALTNQANTSDVIPNGFKTYYVVFYDGPNGTGCSSQIEVAKTAVFVSPPDPAPSNPQMFCASDNPTIGDLNTGTAFATYYWYSSVDINGVPTSGDLPLSTPLVDGNTYYIQVDNGCVSNAIPVTVNIDTPVEPGTSASLEYCNDSLPATDFNLYDLLGSPAVTSGSWSGPLVTSGGHLGTVNISTLTAENNYVFTYTVPSAGVCPDGVATVSINVYQVYSSGTASAANPASFCVANLPSAFDLSTLIDNEDAGGQWTQGTTSSGTVITSTIDLSGYTPATYNFTYTQNVTNPCPDQSTTVQVIVLPNPNAGNADNKTFCENELATNSPFNLFDALDGTQDNNLGIWRDASNVTISSTLDLTSLTVAGSPYSFNYTIDNGSCFDTEIITITVEPAPESGTVNAPAEFCQGLAPASFDLYSLIEGESGTGTWTNNTTLAVVANPTSIDLSGFASNTYDFTFNIDPIGGCDDEDVIVSVIINPLPNTGNANNPAPFCENDSALNNTAYDLFTLLTGTVDSGGTWSDDSTTPVSGVLSGNILDLSQLIVNTYNFRYSVTDANGCSNSTTVTIVIEPAPESGIANAPAEFCQGLAPASFDLYSLIEGESGTGTWTNNTTLAVVANPTSIDLSGFASNTYDFTFNIDPIGGCDDEDVIVSVIINPLPNTGNANNPAPFCENDSALNNTAYDLFTLLTGTVDSGGTWSDDSTTPVSGVLSGNILDLSQLIVNTYNFRYSVTDANGCSNSTTVTIVIEPAPESGIANAPAEFCQGLAPASFDLYSLIEGESGTGTWTNNTTLAVVANPTSIDLSGFASNTYDFTFNIDPIGGCDDEDVIVSVIINPLPNTGTANNPAPFCENDSALNNTAYDLFTLLTGTVDSGGTWSDDSTTPVSGVLSGNILDLSQLIVNTYNFRYSVTDANGCSNSTTVTIVIEPAPESGIANAPIEFCIASITTGQTYNLFDLLTGEDQAGVWIDDDSSLALSGNLVTLDGLASGIYNFTYDVNAIGSCDDVLVTVTIIINDTPAPTAPATQEFCDAATIANLSATGTTIQWYDNATGGTALLGTTSLINGEDYFATQTDATSGCESSVRTAVTATIYQSPKSGSAIAMADCNTNNAVDLFTGLDGTQDAGGVWSNDDGVGTLTGSTFDATGVIPGNYQFTYLVTASAPCVDSSTTITVTVDGPLNAGTNNTLDVCSNNGTTDLFTLIGSADTGGTWSPAMASGTGVFDPLVDAPGTYIYTLTNACGTDTSEVVVSVTLAPNAGTDNTAAICVIDGPTDLFTFLGTSAQSGGTWSPALPSGTGVFNPGADTPGIYTYTVAAVSPCSPDSSAQITVTVSDSPQIVVLDANPSFCLVDTPTVADLAASIQSTGTVNWYTDATLATPLTQTTALIDGEDYFATQTTSSGCESSLSVQINVTINDTPTPTLIDAGKEYCINDGPTINDLTLNISEYNASSNNVVWYDAITEGTVISDSESLVNLATYYAALIDAITGCESSVRLAVTPDLTSCGELFLPDGFSPNGDGVNDTYEVNNLDIIYPKFEMQIYNRYGNIVYKGNASTPRFNGRSNQSRTTVKGDLPVGMYYYIFIFNDGENKPKQGNLYLSR